MSNKLLRRAACTYQTALRRILFCTIAIICLALPLAGESRKPVNGDQRFIITTPTLAAMIRAGVPMALLDARTGTHDDGRRIPGAVSVAPDAPAEVISRLVANKSMLVITYCKDPECPNFAVLAAHLRKLGYSNVLEHPAGIEGWAAAGQQIIRAAGSQK